VENRNEYHDMILTKMKLIVTVMLLTATLLMSTVSSTDASGKGGYRIYDTASGQPVSLKKLGESIGAYDVMVFGEYHDNQVLHRLEEEVLIEVYTQHPNLAVSLEMFERDAQQTLNAYLAGRLNEAVFLEQSRPWKNYGSDYHPLVEFAKEKGLRVLAANIPRSMAAYYARQGTLGGIDGAMRHYLPAVHRAPDGEYRQRFFAQMQAISEKHTVMAVTEKQMEAFYRAQCLKDDTMAESIAVHAMGQPGFHFFRNKIINTPLQRYFTIIGQRQIIADSLQHAPGISGRKRTGCTPADEHGINRVSKPGACGIHFELVYQAIDIGSFLVVLTKVLEKAAIETFLQTKGDMDISRPFFPLPRLL